MLSPQYGRLHPSRHVGLGMASPSSHSSPGSTNPLPQKGTGMLEGTPLGLLEGEAMGDADGAALGMLEGDALGMNDGASLGTVQLSHVAEGMASPSSHSSPISCKLVENGRQAIYVRLTDVRQGMEHARREKRTRQRNLPVSHRHKTGAFRKRRRSSCCTNPWASPRRRHTSRSTEDRHCKETRKRNSTNVSGAHRIEKPKQQNERKMLLNAHPVSAKWHRAIATRRRGHGVALIAGFRHVHVDSE